MRFVIGFLSGILGLLAGWAGLAMLVIALAGADREGGTAMGAFFNIGPIGGLIGFVAGVWLFIKFGVVARVAPPAGAEPDATAPASPRTRVSPVFAAVVVLLAAGLGWWGWYEFIRSPYLSHGYMTLELQFRLPSGMALPADAKDVHIVVWEGQQGNDVTLSRAWHGTDGDRRVILAKASLSRKTSRRIVTLELPGVPEQTWQVSLPSDPDPTPGFSPWRTSSAAAASTIEMNFSLSAER